MAEIALMSGKLADTNSTVEGAHASAAQAAAKIELLTSACDTLHNDLSGLTAERVRSAVPYPILNHATRLENDVYERVHLAALALDRRAEST